MPVYLLHGFRWPREGFAGIRVHAVVNNLEDLSVEYIQNEHSRTELLASFHKAFPDIMKELDGKLEFIEQYNPDDLDGPNAVSQPYAYIGDKVVTLAANPGSIPLNITQATNTPASPAAPNTAQGQPRPSTETPKTATSPKIPDATSLSINVQEVIAAGPGLTNRAWEAMADLRDNLAKGEDIGWWVIYNGDPEREVLDSDDDSGSDYEREQILESEPVTQSSTKEMPAGPPQAPQQQQDASQSEEALRAMTLRQKALGPGSPERVQPQHHQRYQQQAEQQRASILQQRQHHQQRDSGSKGTLPTGIGPRTAPNPNPKNAGDVQTGDITTPISPRHPQVPPSPIPQRDSGAQIQPSDPNSNLSPNLTALPTTTNYIPPTPPEVVALLKGKQKEPASASKSQALRKKLFGKRQ